MSRWLSVLGRVWMVTELTDNLGEDFSASVSPLENWMRPPRRPCTMWIKTIQQDLKSNNLSLNEATDVAQNCPLWRVIWLNHWWLCRSHLMLLLYCDVQGVECRYHGAFSLQDASSSVFRLLGQVSHSCQEAGRHWRLWSTRPCLESGV